MSNGKHHRFDTLEVEPRHVDTITFIQSFFKQMANFSLEHYFLLPQFTSSFISNANSRKHAAPRVLDLPDVLHKA